MLLCYKSTDSSRRPDLKNTWFFKFIYKNERNIRLKSFEIYRKLSIIYFLALI